MRLIVCECGRGRRHLQNHINSSPFSPSQIPSLPLICACLHLLVYCMGGAMGGLERLHHLFLPGCRRPVQGETFKCLSCLVPAVDCWISWSQAGGEEKQWQGDSTHPPLSLQVLMTAVPKQFSDNSFRTYRENDCIVGHFGANVSMSRLDFKDQFQKDLF